MAKEKKELPLPDALRNLPSFSLEEAAWVVGITPEALERFLRLGNAEVSGKEGERRVDLVALARTGFDLLSQREAQVEMLRLQLSADILPEHALQPEVEVAGAKPRPAKAKGGKGGRKKKGK